MPRYTIADLPTRSCRRAVLVIVMPFAALFLMCALLLIGIGAVGVTVWDVLLEFKQGIKWTFWPSVVEVWNE